MSNNSSGGPVLLYDGVCGFCNANVQMIIRHDRAGTLRFAALQSDYGKAVIARHAELKNVDSMVLIERTPEGGERVSYRSTGALRMAAYLGGIWKLFLIGYIIPRPAREIGLLHDRVIAAHMVWPTEEDIKTLAARGVGVGHCPQSNMKLAAGTAPVPQMLRAGVAVGLGTDGAASNNDLSMWEEIDTAAKLHKLIAKDPTVVSAREALEMATIKGARAINLDKEIGSLEAGKRADIIIVGMNGAHQTPLYNVYSHLVYATKASDVETVMINGRIVMQNRRVLTINELTVRRKANEYRDRIRNSLKSQ